MADEGKKVSFGFAKSIKKTALKILPTPEEKKVDYIECLDRKSIKVVGEKDKAEGPLIIPLLGSKTWHDRILNKTDADIFEPKTKDRENGMLSKVTNGNTNSTGNGTLPMDISKIKKEKPDDAENVPRSLEEQAADEILQDLNGDVKTENSNLHVPLAKNETLHGERESTLEDYEQIPIDAFGLAMLRGMGWKPGKGIGKNEKLVVAVLPELRPRGMGLGADKVTLQKQNTQKKSKEEELLKVEKGAFVKIIAGKQANNYGQIEGFDDEAGRLIVKMALTGESQSLTESLIQPVTKSEYTKNSKVLNATKYEKYKNKIVDKEHDEGTSIQILDSETSSDEDSYKRKQDREKDLKINEKTKKRSKHNSDDSTDSDKRRRKRRNSSDGDGDYRHKRSKKSKKNRKRESSSERSRRKSKKKDKERDKTRERKIEYSESSDRKKHKKHRKSRSRSPSRR